MKTPRVQDFDPSAKIPELGSPMDSLPSIQKPKPSSTPVPLTKRVMKQRHPFDIYHDQYDTLKKLADEDRRRGGAGSMSAMVREAIDTFIATKTTEGK